MLRVQDVMTPRPQTVSGDTRLAAALDLMVEERFRHLPVADAEGRLVGILSDRDLKSALPDRSRPRRAFDEVLRSVRVEQVMTREPITVSADAPARDAIQLMLSCRVGALPVLDGAQLVGIVTQSDLLRHFLELLAEREAASAGSISTSLDMDVETGPARIFLLSSDLEARTLAATSLIDAGYAVQSFVTLQEMMAVWHLVLPDVLVVDRDLESDPNLPLLERSRVPRLWLEREDEFVALMHGDDESVLLPGRDSHVRLVVDAALETTRSSKHPPKQLRPKVLIAEDDHVIRRTLVHHLRRHGYRVAEASDGREAQECLTKERFDAVILDINMPHASGFDVLKTLREEPYPPKTLVLSASRQDDTVMKAFQLGADDFVKKPFNPELLVRRLERLILGHQASAH